MRRAGLSLAFLVGLTTATEDDVCNNWRYLLGGALGISVVSTLVTLLISYIYYGKKCTGKKKKEKMENQKNAEEVSLQYASLQNLKTKVDAAVRRAEDPENKTCYASVVDVRNQIQDL